MYIPDIYKNEDPESIRQFLEQNGFGMLVNLTEGRLWATHIPMTLQMAFDGAQVLEGHVSIENPQSKSFASGPDALAIFQGPHSYISSSWYDFESVPTWNYSAVHLYGKIRAVDEDALKASLKRLIDKYEAASENPVQMEDLSPKTLRMIRGIAGFELVITEIQAKEKLSQNRDAKNFANIISELRKTRDAGAKDIANAMAKCPFQSPE